MAKEPKVVTPNATKRMPPPKRISPQEPPPKPLPPKAGRIGNLGDFAHPPKRKKK